MVGWGIFYLSPEAELRGGGGYLRFFFLVVNTTGDWLS